MARPVRKIKTNMLQYVLRRIWQMIPTVLGVIVITFILFNVVGGSPAAMTLGKNVSPQLLEDFDEGRGFNKPLLVGLWSKTRALEDSEFAVRPDPWRASDTVAHDAATGRLILQPGRHAIPLRFHLRKETSYRLRMAYRLSEDGEAYMRWGTRAGAEEDGPSYAHMLRLEPSGRQQAARAIFAIAEHGAELQPHIEVVRGSLDIEAMDLRRRARHVFDSQFFHYLGQIARFDLGRSAQTNERISSMIRAGVKPSLTLTVPVFFIGLVVAISLSLVCAFFRNTWLDRFFVVFGVALMSINYLVWIIVGQYLMAYKWGWFPVWGYESMAYLALPIVIGVISGLGTDLRFYRTIMLDEMYKEYVRTAFAKGVSRTRVLFTHVLKNAMITVVTNVVIAIPFLYTGSLLLESFFGIPGLGYLGINAINSSDVDVIRAIVLIGSVLFVIANLLTDICYALVDPRVKLS